MDAATESQTDPISLETRPGIFIIGSSTVGKRTLLSRLLAVDSEDAFDSASEVNVHGWTINTKYYTADVAVWMAHLHDEFSVENVPAFQQMTALVMVFDMNDLSSLTALQGWVAHTDIQNFEILLCIGNKVDLVPDHPVHAEYRRRLLKHEDSAVDLYSEFSEYGISELIPSLHISSKMVLHAATLLKLHLQLAKPAVAGFSTTICVLKLLMGFRFFKDEALYQSKLFLFRLSQIAFNSEPQVSTVQRMERALRLIFPTHATVTPSINSTSSQEEQDLQNDQEEMFYSLSMLAL